MVKAMMKVIKTLFTLVELEVMACIIFLFLLYITDILVFTNVIYCHLDSKFKFVEKKELHFHS